MVMEVVMSKNEMLVGVPRLGWLADGDTETPATATLLQDDGKRISLTIPWQGSGDSPYERWFCGNTVRWGDDPEGTRFSYKVPDVLWFEDGRGLVTLVGCRGLGMTGFMSVGEGRADVRFAVMGGRSGSDYRQINGLRSEMPGLGEWMSLRSLKHEVSSGPDGRVRSLDLHLESPPAVRLSRSLNLLIRPSFSYLVPGTPDTTTIKETLLIETYTKDLRDWYDHFVAHNTVRDLVDIAAWSGFGYSNQWANREDDPERFLSGDLIGPRWSEVRTYVARRQEPRSDRTRFLFTFADIGAAGVRRWAVLRAKFSRGINPILASFEQRGVTLEGELGEVGIGLDGIGYQLALDAGESANVANAENHKCRLLRMAADLTVLPPFDIEEWAQRSADAYNGIKHANRDMPDPLTMVNTLRENRIVFRLWIAGRVRVPKSTLARNLELDPMTEAYVGL
jgi:ApeA N-terminal domain 1